MGRPQYPPRGGWVRVVQAMRRELRCLRSLSAIRTDSGIASNEHGERTPL